MNERLNPGQMRTPTEIREESEDVGRNASGNPTMGDIINRRYSRRGFLGGSLAVAAIGATVSPMALLAAGEAKAQAAAGSRFSFDEVAAGVDPQHHVADGYDADILIRWGDKVFADSPAFDPMNQTADAQARQFGYNNDYIGFAPLEDSPGHGLLLVNHEYTNAELMFPGFATVRDGKVELGDYTKELVDIEMAAHGGTILELRRNADGKWQPAPDGTMNRRITVSTEMQLSGPVAGHDRVKTNADPSGTKVLGTLNN